MRSFENRISNNNITNIYLFMCVLFMTIHVLLFLCVYTEFNPFSKKSQKPTETLTTASYKTHKHTTSNLYLFLWNLTQHQKMSRRKSRTALSAQSPHNNPRVSPAHHITPTASVLRISKKNKKKSKFSSLSLPKTHTHTHQVTYIQLHHTSQNKKN